MIILVFLQKGQEVSKFYVRNDPKTNEISLLRVRFGEKCIIEAAQNVLKVPFYYPFDLLYGFTWYKNQVKTSAF